jgi:hypothetical protein
MAGPSGTGVEGTVDAFGVFDDGSGPALYAGGYFLAAGGVTVHHIARWDGSGWSALDGPTGVGVDGQVMALGVFDDGSGPALYAGGGFDTAGGVIAYSLARWRGGEWSDPGTFASRGTSGPVSALAVFDDGTGPALFAGGEFPAAGGVTVNSIGRWDGSEWSALGGPSGEGVNGSVSALAVLDDGTGPALFAGGEFDTAGGVAVNNIARWDGSAWSALAGPSGAGVGGSVGGLAIYDDGTGPALYVGGMFTLAGGVTVNNIARWDGSEWSDVGGGVAGSSSPPPVVHALAVFDDGTGSALYAGGEFWSAGGVNAYNIGRWDGFSWSDLAGGVYSQYPMQPSVEALAVFDDGSGPDLYVGGGFETAGGFTVNNIARWNGSSWSGLSGPSGTGVAGYPYSPPVAALAVYDGGSGPALYAGGEFWSAGGVTVNAVARWDGDEWSDVGGGVGDSWEQVYALTVLDEGSGQTLFVGGEFLSAGGLPSANIAAWKCTAGLIFADGFEDESTGAWSFTMP